MPPRQRVSSIPTCTTLSDDSSFESDDAPPILTNGMAEPSQFEAAPPAPCVESAAVSTTAAELARDRHDLFNLFALVPLIMLTLINWDWSKLSSSGGLSESWTGEYFNEYWTVTMTYFFVDLILVACVPICVKSPGVIIKHHLVAITYLIAPYIWPLYQCFMGACLSVEINTWFLIARRVLYKRKESIPAVVADTVTAMFYVSWVAIRIILYPMILVAYIQLAIEKVTETGSFKQWPMVCIPVHFFLCVLNLQWSYALFSPMVARWWRNEAKRTSGISSGL